MMVIFLKEIKAYFSSATAYIFMSLFLFLAGLLFTLTNVIPTPNSYFNNVISSLSFIFVLMAPILTMRCIAEERRSRTDQLLFTSPQSVYGIVAGKYLAVVTLFLITLLITGLYPIILSMFGKVALLEIFAAYAGLFLMGSCFLAIGVFISALTDSITVAAIGSIGASLFIWLLDSFVDSLPTSMISGIIFSAFIVLAIGAVVFYWTRKIVPAIITFAFGAGVITAVYFIKSSLFEGFITKFFGWFSLLERNTMFSMGVLDLSSVLYYISFSFILILLTVMVIDKRRMR